MLDRYDNFFLGTNVNEPVAIEVSVAVRSISGLKEFLESVGFQVTNQGYEKDKILINPESDKHPDWGNVYSIITPALKPEDRKAFWDSLKYALETYAVLQKEQGTDINIMYPHIIDLKSIIPNDTTRAKTDYEEREITDILRELQNSKDVLNTYRTGDNYFDDLEKYFHGGTLISGSTVPDPYSVVTSYNNRFLRYATRNLQYGIDFTGIAGGKKYSGHENILEHSGIRMGFVFQYLPNTTNQLEFDNAGIELKKGSNNYAEYNETAVTRFDNPCVGTYLVWSSIRNPNNVYIYKIDENDPRYQKIKKYWKTHCEYLTYAKNERFVSWVQEGDNNQTYMPIKENLEQVNNNIDSLVQQRNKENERLKTMNTDINGIINNISTITTQFRAPVPNYTDMLDVIDNEKMLSISEQQCNESVNLIKQIKSQISDLKNEILSNEKYKQEYLKKISYTESLLEEKSKECNYFLNQLKSYREENKIAVKNGINKFIAGRFQIKETFYTSVPYEIKKEIFDTILSKTTDLDTMVLPERLLKLYFRSQNEEKAELFDLLYQIRQKASKEFVKAVQKQIPNIPFGDTDKEVLTELFKQDIFFIKHTERARKKMQFLMGQAKIKQIAGMNQIANQQAMSLENEG